MRVIENPEIAAYEASVRDRLEVQHALLSSLELSVRRYMDAYDNYLEEQRFLAAKNMDMGLLGRALSKFLSLDFANKSIGTRELSDAFGAFSCNSSWTRDCEYTLPVLLRILLSFEVETTHLGLGQRSRDTKEYSLRFGLYLSGIGAFLCASIYS